MKVKLTLSVDRNILAKARRRLQQRKQSISAEVDALLERIAEEEPPRRLSWSEQFGDLRIPLPPEEGEVDSWYAKHLSLSAKHDGGKESPSKGRK
ncbi:MAG: DUF6364 family protein [Flavobacteriales bacterium]